ncbi:hypothetical protein [Streptacidiphilus sp. MAP12-33]|uniref:hypothetical protein n=1 Tax=Streptacidiphilus sp. MAP12-33 TaxID=3156266 RepID=UPI003519BA96
MNAPETRVSFLVAVPIRAVVEIAAGRILCVASERSDATVEVRPDDATRSSDVTAARRTRVDFDVGVLHVGTERSVPRVLGDSGSVDVTVHLPSGSGVAATSAVGAFHGVGPLGEVVFEGAAGSVVIEEATAVRLVLESGDVAVGRLAGPGEIRTQRGDITVAEARQGLVTLHTGTGRISIGAAPGVAATLDAGVGPGRIINTLRNSDGARAALNIHATTAHGDITARSLDKEQHHDPHHPSAV